MNRWKIGLPVVISTLFSASMNFNWLGFQLSITVIVVNEVLRCQRAPWLNQVFQCFSSNSHKCFTNRFLTDCTKYEERRWRHPDKKCVTYWILLGLPQFLFIVAQKKKVLNKDSELGCWPSSTNSIQPAWTDSISSCCHYLLAHLVNFLIYWFCSLHYPPAAQQKWQRRRACRFAVTGHEFR